MFHACVASGKVDSPACGNFISALNAHSALAHSQKLRAGSPYSFIPGVSTSVVGSGQVQDAALSAAFFVSMPRTVSYLVVVISANANSGFPTVTASVSNSPSGNQLDVFLPDGYFVPGHRGTYYPLTLTFYDGPTYATGNFVPLGSVIMTPHTPVAGDLRAQIQVYHSTGGACASSGAGTPFWFHVHVDPSSSSTCPSGYTKGTVAASLA